MEISREWMDLFDTVTKQRDEAMTDLEDLLETSKKLKAKCEKLEEIAKRQNKQLEELNKYKRVFGNPN